jgi:ABC-type multidrug transport system ATPase subunit
MIRARELGKAYGKKPVLRGVTFEARPGEITLLVGSNGAGKSTVMKILAGLAAPDTGDAFLGGCSMVKDRLGAQRHASFLPQTPSFHPRFSCAQIISFYARLRGMNDSGFVDRTLDVVGLREAAREPSRNLSGGMRQRLALALLVLPKAPILLLDEPGLSLDAEWRHRMQQQLRAEAAAGRVVLVTTHLLAEWNGLADRCLVCREGVIAGELNPSRLNSLAAPGEHAALFREPLAEPG